MKRFLMIISVFVVVSFTAAMSFSITAANMDAITIKTVKQVNSISKTHIRITPPDDSYDAFVVSHLTKSVGVRGVQYEYIIWTESGLSAAARRQLAQFVADNTGVSGVSVSNTLFVSGDPYTWSERPGSKYTLSFNHDMFSLSFRSIIRRFVYGSYVFDSAVSSSATATTTQPVATTATTVTQATTLTETSQARPTITISEVTRSTQQEPPVFTTQARSSTTIPTVTTTSTTQRERDPSIAPFTLTSPTQATQPPRPAITDRQTTSVTSTTRAAASTTVRDPRSFPGSGGE